MGVVNACMLKYYCRVAASVVALHRFLHSKCCPELVCFFAWRAAGVVDKCIVGYMIALLAKDCGMFITSS
jgi:hypothetical protein